MRRKTDSEGEKDGSGTKESGPVGKGNSQRARKKDKGRREGGSAAKERGGGGDRSEVGGFSKTGGLVLKLKKGNNALRGAAKAPKGPNSSAGVDGGGREFKEKIGGKKVPKKNESGGKKGGSPVTQMSHHAAHESFVRRGKGKWTKKVFKKKRVFSPRQRKGRAGEGAGVANA